MVRRHVRALGAALLLGVLLFGGLAAQGADLTPEEQKWVRECLKRMDANSPAVRASAESALLAMGIDALPAVVDALGAAKGTAEREALERVLLGFGRDRVVARLAQLKAEARGTAAKRIQEILEALGGMLAAGAETLIPLQRVADVDGRVLPLRSEHALVDRIPPPLVPGGQPVRLDGRTLHVDTDGDGVPDTALEPGTPRILAVRRPPQVAPRDLHFQWKLGTWFVASAALLRGRLGDQQVELLDVDADGDFAGRADAIRWNDNAFQRHLATRRLQAGPLIVRYDVRQAAEGPVLAVRPEAAPELGRAEAAAYEDLGRWRAQVGLGPQPVDAARCAACAWHARYLVLNSRNPDDAEAATGDGASHSEDPAREGYTPQGAQAAGASAISPGPLKGLIGRFASTMLHRTSLLAPAEEPIGLAAFQEGRHVWSLLWGGWPSALDNDGPVVVPAPGQTGVPTRGAGEWPPPDAPADFYKAPRGYPISVTLQPLDLRMPTLRLFAADGVTAIPGRVWSPDEPIAASHRSNGGSIFLMPLEPLQRGQAYWVVFEAQRAGQPVRHVWTFTTG